MANELYTTNYISNRVLYLLKNKLIYKDLLINERSQEIEAATTQKVGDVINLRVPGVYKAKNFKGKIKKQDINGGTVQVKLAYFKDTSIDVTSKQMMLDIPNFDDQVILPIVYALEDAVDSTCAGVIYKNAKHIVPIMSDTPTKLNDLASTKLILDKEKAPKQERNLVMSPNHMIRYALTDNLSKVSYAGNNTALREAMIGRVLGLNTFDAQNTPNATSTVSGTAKGKFMVESGATPGKVKITGLSSPTATVKIGEGFYFENNGETKLYKFTENGTGASSTIADIAAETEDVDDVSKDVEGFPTKVTTAVEANMLRGYNSLAFGKESYAFISRAMEGSLDKFADISVVSEGGLSIRVAKSYDINTKSTTLSADILFGIGVLKPELSVILQDQF